MYALSPLVSAFTLFAGAVWALAFWRGGAAERLGAAILSGAQVTFLVIVFAISGGARQYVSLLVQLILDGASAVALLLVLLRYGRPWLGVAMLLSAAQFALQSVYLVGQLQKDYWHVLLNNLNYIAIHMSLLVGTLQHWLRSRRKADKA